MEVDNSQRKKRANRQYIISKNENLKAYLIFLTEKEYINSRRCAYLIKSCRSKTGKANVTYFIRKAVQKAVAEVVNKAGGYQNFLDRTNREHEMITQFKSARRALKRNRGKRFKGVQYI